MRSVQEKNAYTLDPETDEFYYGKVLAHDYSESVCVASKPSNG